MLIYILFWDLLFELLLCPQMLDFSVNDFPCSDFTPDHGFFIFPSGTVENQAIDFELIG